MNHVYCQTGEDELEPSSPYFNEKKYKTMFEEDEEVCCPMCLGAKSFWNGEDYIPCNICNATGYVTQDFTLDEELFNNEEEE